MKDIIKQKAKEYAQSIAQNEERQKYCEEDFAKGAEWMYEEFEKNRLRACDNQTKEECEREEKFVMDFIQKNHRIPTFSDTIEITRKEMIDKACEWLENELQKWVILLTFDEQEQRTAIHNTVERLKKAMEE